MDQKEQLLESWRNLHINEAVVAAFKAIPREKFLPPKLQKYAYHDHPLPTLRSQSISQPTTIAIMLHALDVNAGHNIFEVGSGVGYQAALLAHLVGTNGHVTTTEVIPELVGLARKNLKEVGLNNVLVLEADGSEGYPAKAPYDRIILTAAAPAIPPPLVDQLKEGGIVIAPVGDLQSQTLLKGIKRHGKLELDFMGSFTFVPMRGKYGFKEEHAV